jgi:hypothetical protein
LTVNNALTPNESEKMPLVRRIASANILGADSEERNRGCAHQLEWDEAYSNLGRPPAGKLDQETQARARRSHRALTKPRRDRAAHRPQGADRDHLDCNLATRSFRMKPSVVGTRLTPMCVF